MEILMNKQPDLPSRLPELPVELFELSAKLAYSETAPVITNRPNRVVVDARVIATPRINRASHEIKQFHAWVLYPKVICQSYDDQIAVAALKLDQGEPMPKSEMGDLSSMANTRHFYKLSRFNGRDFVTPWGCEVRYGPWFGTIIYTQSCDDQLPDTWALVSSVLAMKVEWEGGPDDMPSVPNLTVVWDPGQPASIKRQCCPEHTWCPSSQSCLSDKITCPGLVPL
jgi:hypothetical protein